MNRLSCRPDSDKLGHGGFTLIELVMIIVALGILAAVAVPKFGDMAEGAKRTATQEELQNLGKAITGNANIIAGGEYVDRGFEGDCGFVPSQLADLVTKPDSVTLYNKLTRLGWNGPYIGSDAGSYLKDAWNVDYVYQPASRRVMSVGGSDTLIVNF